MLLLPKISPTDLGSAVRDRTQRLVRRIPRRGAPHPTAAGYQTPITRPRKQCQVCGSESLRRARLAYPPEPDLTCKVRRCLDCGFVSIVRDQAGKYRTMSTFDELPQGTRAGATDRPGREFHMAVMALEILGGRPRDVLLYGVGSSQDNRHLERLDRTAHVAVGDIMKVRDDEHFVDLNDPPERTFDVVVASEVIEHFRKPRADFHHLFEYVRDDGLVVCGTNINNGTTPVRKHRYIYFPDHTSYYTPDAVRLIAHAEGWLFDFRAPGHGQKRYVLFSRSRDVMENVALYFGRHTVAPMEGSKA